MTHTTSEQLPLKVLLIEQDPVLLNWLEQTLLATRLNVNILPVDDVRKLDDLPSLKGLSVVLSSSTLLPEVSSYLDEYFAGNQYPFVFIELTEATVPQSPQVSRRKITDQFPRDMLTPTILKHLVEAGLNINLKNLIINKLLQSKKEPEQETYYLQ